MGTLEEMAARAGIKGLDWVALKAAGHDYPDPTFWIEETSPLWQKASGIMTTLDVPQELWDRDVLDLWESVRVALETRGETILAAVKAGRPLLAADQLVEMPGDLFASIVMLAYSAAGESVANHTSGLTEYAVTHDYLTKEQAKDDASTTAGIYQALIKMDEVGLLLPIKKMPVATHGLGASPYLIGLAIVVGITALAWIIDRIVRSLSASSLLRDLCQKAQEKGDAATLRRCLEIEDNRVKADISPFAGLGQGLKSAGEGLGEGIKIFAAVLGIGALLYVGATYASRKRGGGSGGSTYRSASYSSGGSRITRYPQIGD